MVLATTYRHCMECDTKMVRLRSVNKCEACGIEICSKCKKNHKGLCIWCYQRAPDKHLWLIKFSTYMMILGPVLALFIPAPVPLVFAVSSNPKLTWWSIAYSTAFFLVFLILRIKNINKIRRINTSDIEYEEGAEVIGTTPMPSAPSPSPSREERAPSLAPKSSNPWVPSSSAKNLPVNRFKAFQLNNKSKLCESCGTPAGVEDVFCVACGSRVEVTDDENQDVENDPARIAGETMNLLFPDIEASAGKGEFPRKCSNCGQRLLEDDVFCRFCGKQID
ncbi:hypothetical protein GF325_09680 [Candidatus Bathyarchaeota archaeon]|nr:hypothetical protein [Candidatus Bathyarchaeota archaeon]